MDASYFFFMVFETAVYCMERRDAGNWVVDRVSYEDYFAILFILFVQCLHNVFVCSSIVSDRGKPTSSIWIPPSSIIDKPIIRSNNKNPCVFILSLQKVIC